MVNLTVGCNYNGLPDLSMDADHQRLVSLSCVTVCPEAYLLDANLTHLLCDRLLRG